MPMGVSNSNVVDFFTFMWYNQFDKLEFNEVIKMIDGLLACKVVMVVAKLATKAILMLLLF